MVFFYPTPGDRREIYIPRGRFQEALELSRQEDWEELCKFPTYSACPRLDPDAVIQLTFRVIAGQGYEEWD
jgi:hypothetical protein